jgi:hypothetical protein
MALALRRKKSADVTPDGGDAEKKVGRFKQLYQAYTFTKEHDKRLPLILLGTFVLPIVLLVLVGTLTGVWVLDVLGVFIGLLGTMTVLSRRVQKATFASVAGQPGVAAAVVDQMRGDWRVTPAVQVNRDQDLVHRVLGRPGIILLAEGRGSRALVAAESRRLRKVVGDTPIHTLVVGDGEDETPLGKVQVKLMRMPRTLKPAEITNLEKRLKALPTGGQALPVPKGPVPTRVPRGRAR